MRRTISLFLILLLLTSLFIVPVLATDTNEPNNVYQQATLLTMTNLTAYAISYISSSTDVDWYKVSISHLGLYSLSLTNNSTGSSAYSYLPANYNIYVYNYSMTLVASSCSTGTMYENCYFNLTTSGLYYFKVVGYAGAYNSNVPYKLVIQHGDTNMMTEACRYRDYSSNGFYERSPNATYWHDHGVAYSFGNKDAFSFYVSSIATANSNDSTPFTSWSNNNANYLRPGLKYSEYLSGVSQINYCGIDCSGLIQRCAQAAGSRYKIARDSPLAGGNGLWQNCVGSGSFGSWSTTYYSTAFLVTGAIGYNSNHVFMFAKINPSSPDDCVLIEAAGKAISYGGRVTMESTYAYYINESYTFCILDT